MQKTQSRHSLSYSWFDEVVVAALDSISASTSQVLKVLLASSARSSFIEALQMHMRHWSNNVVAMPDSFMLSVGTVTT